MRKRILAVILMLAMVSCFAACNQGENKDESSAESKVSDTDTDKKDSEESSTDDKTSEESYDMGDYIDQNIKNVESYKKIMSAGKGDVIIISSKDYVSEYYKFDNGEIGVMDKSTEKGNEYTYLKYTEGNKMYTVDVNGKLYAESNTAEDGEDSSTDKEKFFSDLTNYMYYGITYMGTKDGVEIYDIPQTKTEDTAEEDGTADESTDGSESADDSNSNTNESSVAESSEEESSKEPDDMKRYIKITDTGLVMYDYLNGEKQSTIEITIRKITDADKKQFTIDGCEKYEESSAGDISFNEEDLPEIPDLDASVESEDDTSKESKESKAEASKE